MANTERQTPPLRGYRHGRLLALAVVAVGGALAVPPSSGAEELVLKDGRVLRGNLGQVTGLVEIPKPLSEDGGGEIPLIVFVDDNLRRTYVPKRQILEARPDQSNESTERFSIPQRVKVGGPAVQSVGMPMRVTPFDEYGRRIFSMLGPNGKIDVIQGITEVTPKWTRVQGISHYWDMRIATSSIPRETLYRVLVGPEDDPSPELRKKIARLYIQMERYEDAVVQLQAILENPDVSEEEKNELRPTLTSLKALAAQRLLGELQMRRQAGQHQLVYQLLEEFPSEGVGGERLQQVREIINEYETQAEQGKRLTERLEELVDEIPSQATRYRLEPIVAEIKARVGFSTLRRLAGFAQLVDDDSLLAEEKVAMAVSGWLVGADEATRRLPVALSLYDVRGMITEYMAADAPGREEILEQLAGEEGATPRYVTAILAHMEPFRAPQIDPQAGGYYSVDVPQTIADMPNRYLIQLPPEYTPLRRYPAVVTLHGAGTTPQQQIDWWAGERNEQGIRLGQAGRHGYIVIAPQWTQQHQASYHYSVSEHMAVLNAVRDACRRFSIDTDRMFLSGHFLGGDAAWDIGLAHPSLWAGVIPIGGRSDRYSSFYWKNAKLLPFYVVMGQLDGTLLTDNARDLDRYLKAGYPVTVVEYLGRGRENLSDEILRIFEWMQHQTRTATPLEFEAYTMRMWDDFFWYVEVDDLPSGVLVEPSQWPPGGATRAMKISAKMPSPNANSLYVRAGSSRTTVWLSPELVDFEQRLTISINGRRVDTRELEPQVKTILEDVRSRVDRFHPFWARVEVGRSRQR